MAGENCTAPCSIAMAIFVKQVGFYKKKKIIIAKNNNNTNSNNDKTTRARCVFCQAAPSVSSLEIGPHQNCSQQVQVGAGHLHLTQGQGHTPKGLCRVMVTLPCGTSTLLNLPDFWSCGPAKYICPPRGPCLQSQAPRALPCRRASPLQPS